jgi:hypothetical protein
MFSRSQTERPLDEWPSNTAVTETHPLVKVANVSSFASVVLRVLLGTEIELRATTRLMGIESSAFHMFLCEDASSKEDRGDKTNGGSVMEIVKIYGRT